MSKLSSFRGLYRRPENNRKTFCLQNYNCTGIPERVCPRAISWFGFYLLRFIIYCKYLHLYTLTHIYTCFIYILFLFNIIMNCNILEEFIDLYRSHPCLWQIKSKEYHDRQLRKAAYKVLMKNHLTRLKCHSKY